MKTVPDSTWVLIGPVYPYKGGISHYTGLMYRALAKSHDVTMISYKMQYPKLLFKKEQRDYDNDSFKIEGRMKKPEYAAFTANIYRKWADRYLEYGREEYERSLKDGMILLATGSLYLAGQIRAALKGLIECTTT